VSGATAKVARRPAAPVSSRIAAEREAERAGELTAARPPVRGWSFAAQPPSRRSAEPPDDPRVAAIVASPGRPLEPTTRSAFEHQLGAGLSTVRVHDDPAAAAEVRALGVEGLAVGDEVALATGRHDPTSPRARALLGHELAHVVQQRAAGATLVQLQGGGTVTPATTLDALPEADRKRIQVVTAAVTVPDIAGKFATTGTKTTLTLPSGVTAAFDTSVDPALQHGLQNVAASLSTTIELTPAPLPANTTTTLELDVPSKGKGLYRFTHTAPLAVGKGAPPAPRILIEALGVATAPAGTKAPPPPTTPGAPPTPDPVAEKIKNHSLKHSYTGDELDALRAALDRIPDAQLSVVDGLSFDRKSADPNDPTTAGHYDPPTHTVTIYNRAFAGTQTRFKAGAGTTTSSAATRAILHEIGHAIDLAPMRKAEVARKQADAAVAALSQKYTDPDDPTKFRAKSAEEDKDIKATLKAQQDAEAKVLTTQSISGTKTVKDPAGKLVDVIGTAADNDFRKAVAKDGGKAVTAYGDTDFQESFAEAYSLYITSPSTLKSLRPNVFDFLDKNLPK